MTVVRHLWLRLAYRRWARLLHRFNLHHTRRIGPLLRDGSFIERCEWCGLSRRYGGPGIHQTSAQVRTGRMVP